MNKTNTTIELIAEYDLQSLLMRNARQVTTKQQITLKLVNPTLLKTYISLNVDEPTVHMATLVTDAMELEQFIIDNQLKTIGHLDQIQTGTLWLQYLAGNAEVRFEVRELEATIRFRRVNNMTIIYSRELHFYDDVYQPYSMTPQFEDYLKRNKNRLIKINAARLVNEI